MGKLKKHSDSFAKSVEELIPTALDCSPLEIPGNLVRRYAVLIKAVGGPRITAWAESLSMDVPAALEQGRYAGAIPDRGFRKTVLGILESYSKVLILLTGSILKLKLGDSNEATATLLQESIQQFRSAAAALAPHIEQESPRTTPEDGLAGILASHQASIKSGIVTAANADAELQHVGAVISLIENMRSRGKKKPPDLVSQAYKRHIMYLDDCLKPLHGETKKRPKGLRNADIGRFLFGIVRAQGWPLKLNGYKPTTPHFDKERSPDDIFQDRHTRNLSMLRDEEYEHICKTIELLVGHPVPLVSFGK